MRFGWAVLLVAANCGCSQAFRFTEDSGGTAVDGGTKDGGSDGGCLRAGECECQGASDCAGARSICAPDHRCVECVAHSDCGLNGRCDPKTLRCTTACDGGLDCDGGARSRCSDDAPRHCIACDDNVNCGVPPAPFCAESVGFCVGCERDSQCDGGIKTHCDTRVGACVQCVSSSQCAATEFCRVATGGCDPR